MKPLLLKSLMQYQWLAMDKKMELNIGWSEIVGAVIGVSKDLLELLEESIISK